MSSEPVPRLSVFGAWRFALAWGALAGLLVGAVGLAWPQSYLSEALIMAAPRTDYAVSAAARDLGLRMPGSDSPLMELDRETMLAVLASRQFRERIILAENLLPRLYPNRWDAKSGSWKPGLAPSAALAVQEGRLDGIFRVEARKRGRSARLFWRDEDPTYAQAALARTLEALAGRLDLEGREAGRRDLETLNAQALRTLAELTEWEKSQPARDRPQPRIDREVAARREVLAELEKRRALMASEEGRHAPRFLTLDPPSLPARPDRPRPLLYALTAFVVGTCLAMAWRLVIPARQAAKPGRRARRLRSRPAAPRRA